MNAQILDNLGTVVDQYKVFLVDAWGVLHDGKTLYPGAGTMLEQLMAKGKKVIVLSNAARRIPAFRDELEKVGISRNLYTDAVTSGELSWQALKNQREGALSGVGRRYFYQGPQRSRGILDGLSLQEVEQLADADFIVNTGVEGNLPNASTFSSLLKQARDLGLPMLCANPDSVAIRGGVTGISAGAIALAYEQLGGKAIYYGKPHLPVYRHCFELFAEINPCEFVMLGDSLATDIKGANNAGIDSVFLKSGIHQQEFRGTDAISQSALFKKYQAWPNYVLSSLQTSGLQACDTTT